MDGWIKIYMSYDNGSNVTTTGHVFSFPVPFSNDGYFIQLGTRRSGTDDKNNVAVGTRNASATAITLSWFSSWSNQARYGYIVAEGY